MHSIPRRLPRPPGRREEHTDPHIVAGWRHPAELEPPLRAGGSRDFRKLNGLLNQLAKDLNTDLWTLDSLFWRVKQKEGDGTGEGGAVPEASPLDAAQSFALERHLHDFLFENWDKTQLGKEWALYAEDNDPETAY